MAPRKPVWYGAVLPFWAVLLVHGMGRHLPTFSQLLAQMTRGCVHGYSVRFILPEAAKFQGEPGYNKC